MLEQFLGKLSNIYFQTYNVVISYFCMYDCSLTRLNFSHIHTFFIFFLQNFAFIFFENSNLQNLFDVDCNRYVSFSAVVILCFVCTITTNFEYELKCSKVGFNFANEEHCFFESTTNELCDVDISNMPASCQIVQFEISSGKPCTLEQVNASGTSCQEVHLIKFVVLFIWFFTHKILVQNIIFCIFFLIKKLNSYCVRPSDFSRSESYQNFFYYPSTFFGTLLPFVLLLVLNSFLIWTVRKSHKMRHTMTNTRQVNAIFVSNFHIFNL